MRASALPGSGAMFALRAIGLVLLVRWLYSMIDIVSRQLLVAMVSSPWAVLYLALIFLLLVLPGAHARADRPFHPLPQLLRQTLRLFAAISFVFAIWTVGAFAWAASSRRLLDAVISSNGWLVVAPALYAVVVWLCRPRALWRTNVAARRFAIGRYAIALDAATRTVTVWMESRKVGQYDARELSVRWPDGSRRIGRAKFELVWNSPAAAGHNSERVMSVPLRSEDDRIAARALDAALQQQQAQVPQA